MATQIDTCAYMLGFLCRGGWPERDSDCREGGLKLTVLHRAVYALQKLGMLPYVMGYRAGYKAATSADGPGGKGYDAAYRTGMQVR